MTKHELLSEGEHMRLVMRWLSDNTPITKETIDEASVRFDLSPLEEEYLLQEFVHKQKK
jgi:hypothetical protein